MQHLAIIAVIGFDPFLTKSIKLHERLYIPTFRYSFHFLTTSDHLPTCVHIHTYNNEKCTLGVMKD